MDKNLEKGRAVKALTDKNRGKSVSNRLGVLFIIMLLAFVGLGIRLVSISRENNDEYQRKILAQSTYDSKTIPAKRGEIIDCNGTILATSKENYNVILDAKVLLAYEEQYKSANDLDDLSETPYRENTLNLLHSFFGADISYLNEYITNNPSSQYLIVKSGVEYEDKERFELYQTKPSDEDKSSENSLYNEYIKGVTFEKYYVRDYPQNSLACDVIGFSKSEGQASYGLEEYYNYELTGTSGRQYGFLSDDTTVELTTISATDGDSLVLTLDSNVQRMVEESLKSFALEYKDNAREGLGADNIGCIVMRADTGEILAMASYPDFDLNDPTDISSLYTEEEIKTMEEEGTLRDAYDALWKNFCIQDTYEPGSVMKPFTVAMGLETGKVTGYETYVCNGSLTVGDYEIHCHNTSGDGTLTVKGAVAQSCNVALMYMVETIGKKTFLEFQNIFNFGLKTNIDLSGETRTDSVVFTETTLGETELATASFGQGFNVTMIQMCAGYAALVNGGYYYEPHVVKQILNSSGAVVENIEPRLVKQVVSNSTSEKIVEYCNAVVTDGTGWRAKPLGYTIGGKTGTAETFPRGNGEYVVSFISHAPANDPEIICYVVIDRPNVEMQEDAKYATIVSKDILTKILPYLNIPMTEELTEEEMEELAASEEITVYTNRIETEDSESEESFIEKNTVDEDLSGDLNEDSNEDSNEDLNGD